ncbi:MAG TPA: hypothetical protein PKM10_07375 [Halanaerobiales bacterium]|nr:hypothetical protein [Halanaerobiales bacterium]HPZ63258.1 hypothetical protein [Halanaerobiales bacterium]HQD04484.1 hypothetical protein [Halanaerobiales bacterium]
MARFLQMKKVKYLFLILTTAYMALSINYFIYTVMTVGMDPFNNITAAMFQAEHRFVLKAEEETNLHLLLKTEIGQGFLEINLMGEDGKEVFDYRTTSGDFINEVIPVDKGSYIFTINRDVIDYKETLRLYFDKRYIIRQGMGEEQISSNSNI